VLAVVLPLPPLWDGGRNLPDVNCRLADHVAERGNGWAAGSWLRESAGTMPSSSGSANVAPRLAQKSAPRQMQAW